MPDLTRYPLCWPSGWKRAASRSRALFGKHSKQWDEQLKQSVQGSKSSISVADGVTRVLAELRCFGVCDGDAVISTNVPVRLDGLPRSDRGEPKDPGVAVYWELSRKKQCMAIDIYDRVADNLAAVAATLSALRAIERHGGGAILERAFQGFAQLPASIIAQRPWREVLNFNGGSVTAEQVKTRFRELAPSRHPDTGGSAEQMQELLAARDEALRELA